MSNFDVELRALVDTWRDRGSDLESIITAMRDEIESLQDVLSGEDTMESR